MVLTTKNKIEIIIFIFLKFILKKVFKRDGEVLPVHLLKKFDGSIFESFSSLISSRRNDGLSVIMVTGTNGKTTTANLISEALKQSGEAVCSNSNGANMYNGILGAIMGSFSYSVFSGPSFNAKYLVVETDEKVFPYISSLLKPDMVVLTNFFRDQLDRYGEVNKTAAEIKKAIEKLPLSTALVLPSFEPLASFAGYGSPNPKICYGFDENFIYENNRGGNKLKSFQSDAFACPACGARLSSECGQPDGEISSVFMSRFKCVECGFSSPVPDVSALSGSEGRVELLSRGSNDSDIPHDRLVFMPSIEGDYNVANFLAAYSALKKLDVDGDNVLSAFKNFRTKFGRSFKKIINGIEVNIDLVKNPTGFNGVLNKIAGIACSGGFKPDMLFAFSDRDADGRDVSWIWDVDFESYAGYFGRIIISGRRPFELAVRLKTAGVNPDNILVDHNLKKSFLNILGLKRAVPGDFKKIFILPTYTELLRLKKLIVSA